MCELSVDLMHTDFFDKVTYLFWALSVLWSATITINTLNLEPKQATLVGQEWIEYVYE
jgi:hypothetical protein